MKRSLIHMAAMFVASLLIVGCDTSKTLIDTRDTRVYVPEEGGTTFEKITDESAEVMADPHVRRVDNRLQWWVNPTLTLSKDGNTLAYNVFKNEKRNIFVKSLDVRKSSTQRTFRSAVNDLCFSPDGKTLCFSEVDGNSSRLYLTSATQGTVVTQVSPVNVSDYGPCYSKDGKRIFFTRADGNDYSIWSYDVDNGSFSNYCYGLNPVPINDEEFLCTRRNSKNNYEVWLINYVKGTESIIVSQENHSFSTASLSPDGKWIVCVCNTIPNGSSNKENLDIYAVRPDGSRLTQLTYHPGHDCSPVWAPDGKSIYFLSQRGTQNGEYNISIVR